MSVVERFIEHITYPLHEHLRHRRTLRELDALARLAVLPPEIVQAECTARLRTLLRFANDYLPYYRDQFARYGVDPVATDPAAELTKLPVLEKAEIRTHADQMVYHAVPGGPIPYSSGGTTGDTLHFFIDRVRQAQALAARLFMQRLFGVRPGDRRVYLWGSPIEAHVRRVRRWRDRVLNEIVLDAFDMSPAAMDAQLATIRSFQPRLIYGYPSAAAVLAHHARRRARHAEFPALRLFVLTGEEVTSEQMAVVRETFGCRVASEYGSRETSLMAHTCPENRCHILTPHVHLEVTARGRRVGPGTCGDIVCTTLNNRAQPLMRYRVGDVGTLLAERCPCGLPFPLLRLEGGKITGFIALADGRLCHGAITSHVLRDEPGIVEFKTYQHTVAAFEVLLVTDDTFDPVALRRIEQRYRDLFGPHVRVACHLVDHIPPDPSGKRRYVVSDVAPRYGDGEAAVSRDLSP